MKIDDMRLAEIGPITMKVEKGKWKVASANAKGEGATVTLALENLIQNLIHRSLYVN